MILPPFVSEFNLSELPVIAEDSKPMDNVPLDQAVQALPSEKRIEEAHALILRAVYRYYFAKELDTELSQMSRSVKGPLSSALDSMRTAVVRDAVIAVATTIDEATGRTRSLTHTLQALKRNLETAPVDSSDTETETTVDLIKHIMTTTNPGKVKSLMYVRHIRNKWAGHASLDPSVDTWPTGDTALNYPLLEDGLVRMVNAFDEFGALVQMSPYLQALEEAAHCRTVNPDGTETLRVTMSWAAVLPLAHAMRDGGKASARQLLVQLQ
ncbi:hypothetical protein [Kocuria rosea]|uniref:hypothetical protein n=1 Tax=Kocuria rosea TaxID=1275 RepID=UPI002B24C4AC|nr:hypothetical protein [Kocuria rosea]MEB2529195.1 hypothetical protein [Kocuria rosea]MEB2618320.1 hypothetical protein [Kocuria rosea]